MENNKNKISDFGIIVAMIVITAIIIFAVAGPLETSHTQTFEDTEQSETSK
jgi:hypothetical protein